MLIDLHAHSSEISKCCQIPFDEVLRVTLENGMDGIALTNHYQKRYIMDNPPDDFIERYISEFYLAEEYGRKIGCRVFFGIEVTMELYPSVDLLIYGADPEFLGKHPYIYDYTQKELYEAVKANNGILVQAHPFRNGTTVLDTDYLDGIEINCHPLYNNSYSDEILRIAGEKDLIVTCGGDYHADTYRPRCGMFLPDTVGDHRELCSYLTSKVEKKLCIQEPNCDEYSVLCVP